MADTPESKIFRKLADALTFHPAGAKLFMPDWALEPGDIVKVQSDVDDYDVPIYSMNFTWNGQGMAEVQSTGNQKREPLSALRRKEYQTGRRGAGRIREIEEEFQEFETWKVETDETLENHAGQFVQIGEDVGGIGERLTLAETTIGQTASDAYIIATAAGIKLDENGHPELDEQGHYQYDPDAGDTTLTARINTNATNILAKVSQTDLNTTLSSYLLINSFGTELGTVLDSGGTELAAKIITAIDKQEGESMVTIDADQINLEGVVTAVFLDSRMANIDSLFSTTGYFGGINVHSITTNGGGETGSGQGSITSDILYATSQLSIGHGAGSSGAAAGSFYYQGAEYTPKTIKKAGTLQNNIKLFGTGTDTEIDIGGAGILDASVANNVLTLTKADGTTTVNFSKATALNTGSVEADGETKQAGWSSGTFTVIATQTNKNTTTNQNETNEVGRTTTSLTIPAGHWGNASDNEDVNTFYQGISATIGATVFDTGRSIEVNAAPRYNAGKNSVGLAPMSYTAFQDENYPSSQTIYTDTTGRTDASGTEDNLHRDITLSLDVDDSYVYMKHGSDIIARISNPGSGASYAAGYAKGQENANAAMSGVALNLASTSYSADDNNLTIQILARPKLELFSEDDPPIKTEVLGENEAFDKTMDVAVTNVTISDSSIVYNHNGTYTIGGTGGKVNIGAADGQGGANIPVDTNAHPFTPTEALNDVNVVKGSWTGTAEKSITFTTSAPSPNAGSPKTLTLATSQGNWTWTTVEDASFYQKEVQVKDNAITTAIMTEPVDLPDISVYVSGPGQQQDSWWQTEGTNANKYVVPASTANAYLTSDSSKQHSIGSDTGDESIVINPSQAIEHGKSLVSVTRTWAEYDKTPSGDTTLDPGKTYHLEIKKDSTTVYDELYTVPEQADPTVGDWQLNYQGGTDYTYKTKVKVNGTWYESGNLSAANAYDNGWTGAYGEIGISPTTVNALNPGESVTVSAQGKQASGSPSKTTVESVTVSARALNLKDETFTANDTYAVPEGYDGYGAITVNVQGGGGSSDRRAVFLDNITLAAPTNPEPGFNWQFTESSFAHYTDPVSVETDAAKKTQVTIDASAVYSAGYTIGFAEGHGGVVNVTKNSWNYGRTTFSPSAGTGTGITIDIDPIETLPGMSSATYIGTYSLKDTNNNQFIYPENNFHLYLDHYGTYVYLKNNNYAPSNSNVMARINVNTEPADEPRNVTSISSIKLTPSDISTSTWNPTITYDDTGHTTTNDVPLQIDASDVYNKGLTDGSGLKIENEKSVTASQNNTTITVLPTYTASEQYDVMGSVKVKVQVPTYEGISSAEINDQNETAPAWWRKELGTGTLSSQYGQIKVTGVDGSSKFYVVDASQVYRNGVNAGSGISIDHIKKSGNATFSANYKTVYFDATVYSSATESSATALHTNQVQCNITDAWNDGQSKGYSSGYQQGVADGQTVSKNEIEVATPSTGSSQYSNIDKNYTISKNDKYVLIKITVRGVTKRIQLTLA